MNHSSVRRFCTATIAVLALTWVEVAAATPFLGSAGLTTPDRVITFSEVLLADDTPVTNQFAALGLTVSPALAYNSQGPITLPGISGDYLGNNNSNPIANPFSLRFSAPVTGAVFGLATNPAITTFTAYLNGVEVESFVAATTFNEPEAFIGFVDILFNEILVSVGGGDGAALIDNVQYEFERVDTVPEPPAGFLLAAGIAAMVLRRKK
jgi:hypothetical protein